MFGCQAGAQHAAPLQRQPRSRRKRLRFRECAHRAGPALPSYLALHHAGFSRLPILLPGRWALTPPFHPCLTKAALQQPGFRPPLREDVSQVPLRDATVLSRRRYILCGTFRDVAAPRSDDVEAPHHAACNSALRRSLRGRPLALPGALPFYPEAAIKRLKGCPRTEILGFVTGSCEPTTTVSGLSSRPDCSEPAITRPVRQVIIEHNAVHHREHKTHRT